MKAMRNQTKLVLMTIMFGLFLMSFASAAVTLVSPVAGSNNTGTMIVNVTLAAGDCAECKNVTIWYNATGGATGTLLTTIANDTAGDLEFYNAAVSVAALADLKTYNFSAKTDNGTDQAWSAGKIITIDNTNPVVALAVVKSDINVGNTNDYTWSSSDATSGLSSVSVAVTSPSTSCSIATETTTSGSNTVTGSQETGCTGTYTITMTATDYAGNVGTTTKTFAVSDAGRKNGSNTLGGATQEPSQTQSWIFWGIVIAVIYFAFLRKK